VIVRKIQTEKFLREGYNASRLALARSQWSELSVHIAVDYGALAQASDLCPQEDFDEASRNFAFANRG
jgi:hypothetical protein